MARQKSSNLPSSNEKTGQRQPMIDPPVNNRKHHLRTQYAKGPLAWNVRKADQAPARLAIKNHFVAMVGEYVGTTLFLLLALGATNVANIPTTSVTGATAAGEKGTAVAAVNTSSLLYIALAFGFSLAVNAWIFFRVSGGLFNPAVSFGMALVGALTPLRACLLTVAQILGGMTGAAILDAITPGTLNVRTQLSGGTSVARGLFIEMFMTSMLMITILLLAAEKHKATFLAPIGIGLALFIAELMSVYYTGGSLNPARSFGPNVVLHTFNSYHWIYWLGPYMGAALAAGFYKFIKYLEYETVLGPEADDDEKPKNMNQAGPGVPSLTGGAVPPQSMISPSTAPETAGTTLATQGAGLGDLLTHGPSTTSDAFDLEANTGVHYDTRLDRIEQMLGQLMARGVTSERSTVSEEPRMSMATLTNDSPAMYGKKLPSPITRAAEPLRESGGNYANHDYGNVHTNAAAPVVVADPVDFHSLAGHISPEQQNRHL
ncbi:hypothetical protein QFC22_005028 [Naganishia vaughanmartiniae]|uniref:Uncharacterized protein n=1 Tax=Naganishia vaughanmartiniae TaxID=1424756 RepID=A0ACC2WVT6_9TREE|nr:hypothetical protein QFC22_005028 [Naganishia vaughanmartiniae]